MSNARPAPVSPPRSEKPGVASPHAVWSDNRKQLASIAIATLLGVIAVIVRGLNVWVPIEPSSSCSQR